VTPYDVRLNPALQGGVRDDIQNNVVADDMAALAVAQGQAETGEDRRRQLASGTPGLGVLMSLPQSPAAAAIGKSSLDMPAIGEGLSPVSYVPQHKAYGPASPVYADPFVGGVGFQGGRSEPAVRHAGGDSFAVVSPDVPVRRSLLGRLFRRR
jgi:hypothetical protein